MGRCRHSRICLVLRRLAIKRHAARKGAPSEGNAESIEIKRSSHLQKEQRRKVVGCTFHHLNWRPSLAPSRPRLCRPQPVRSPHRGPSNPLHLTSAIYRNARPPDTADSTDKTSSCRFGLRQPIKICWQSRPHAASFLFGWLDLHSCSSHRKDDAPCVCTIDVAELRGKIRVTADCWTGHASVTKPLLRP